MPIQVHANLQAAIAATVAQREALKQAAEELNKADANAPVPLAPAVSGPPASG